MRKRYLVIGLTAVLVLAVAMPALGGPNPVATISAGAKNIAKRALKKSRKAQKKANSAQTSADAAETTAAQAQGAANQAQGTASAAQGAADAAQSAANQANSALGGAQLARVRYVRANPDPSETTILNLKGLRLVATCGVDDPDVFARTTVANSFLTSTSVDAFSSTIENVAANVDFDPGESTNLLETDKDSVTGHTEYFAPNGGQVSVNWTVREDDPPVTPECTFTGHAIGSG